VGRADDGTANYPQAGTRNPLTGDSDVLTGNLVKRFTATGALLGQWPRPGTGNGYTTPSITAAVDGSVYVPDVSDPQGGSVAVYSPDGRLLRTIIGTPGLEGEIYRPAALAVGPSSELYLLSSGEPYRPDRVSIFGADGSYQRSIDIACIGRADKIAVDSAGRLFLNFSNTILILDQAGDVLGGFGGGGTAPGQLVEPSLNVDANDVLTIAEKGNNRVTRVHINTAVLRPLSAGCGGVRPTTSQIAVVGNLALLPLACAAAPPGKCQGTLELRTSAPRRRRATHARVAVLARARFTLRGSGVIRAAINRSSRAVLGRRRRLSALLVINASGKPAIQQPVTLLIRPRR
jgi:hypothetical protein